MADNEVKIVFRTEADLKGADDMAKAANAMRDQLSHVPKELQNIKPKADEASKSLGKLTLEAHSLKSVAKGLAWEFPLLGKAVAILSNPIAGTIALAVSAYAAFKNWAKAIDEALEKMQGLHRFKQAMEGIKVVHNQVEIAVKKHAEAMAELEKSADPIGDKLQQRLATIQQEVTLKNSLLQTEIELQRLRIESSNLPPDEKARRLGVLGAQGKTAQAATGRAAENAKANALLQSSNRMREQAAAIGLEIPGAELSAAEAKRAADVASQAWALRPTGIDPGMAAQRDALGIQRDARASESVAANDRLAGLKSRRGGLITSAMGAESERAGMISGWNTAAPYINRESALNKSISQQQGMNDVVANIGRIGQQLGSFPMLMNLVGEMANAFSVISRDLPRINAEVQQAKSRLDNQRQ